MGVTIEPGEFFSKYADMAIDIQGDDCPPMIQSFAEIDLGDELAFVLRRMGYKEPTPIQKGSIPVVLAGIILLSY